MKRAVHTTLVALMALSVGCSQEGGDGGDAQPSALECRLNSDCPDGEVCDEGACIADEGACAGPECPCASSGDCAAGQACDLRTGACYALECLNSRGCALGEVCAEGLCVTDVTADRDRDGVPDAEDTCPEVENVEQRDLDGDGVGDACDSDDDNDGAPDSVDNCPAVANPSQANSNGEGPGNACDPVVSGVTVRGRLGRVLREPTPRPTGHCGALHQQLHRMLSLNS